MTKQEYIETHIVTPDDCIKNTSPIYHTLQLLDKSLEYLDNATKTAKELRNKAIEAANDGLTVKQWEAQYIQIFGRCIEDISNDIENIGYDYQYEVEHNDNIVYE